MLLQPSRLIHWAETVGPGTAQVVKTIMERRPHPEQGYRSCLGVSRLAQRYDPQRLEAACTRAAALGACSYRSVHSILAKGLDRVPLETGAPAPPVQHDQLRGAAYFAREGDH